MDGKNIKKSKNISNNRFVPDADYLHWIDDLKKRYQRSQIKAAVKVNSELLKFYWSVGKDIVERQYDNRYGSHFYENLSYDLISALNNKKGLAPTSLWYTKSFYSLYYQLFTNLRQLAEDFELLFCIPWTHHQKIIDKVKGDSQKAMFFVRKTWENQWGRATLVNLLDIQLWLMIC